MRFKNGAIFIRSSGGDVDGDLIMKNNEYYQGYEADATARNMLGMDSDDKVQVGVTTQALNLNSSADPTILIGASSHTLLTSANLLIKGKASDESVTSSTTVQNDDDFVFAIPASQNYSGVLSFRLNGGSSSGFKWQFALPTGGAMAGLWFKWSTNSSSWTDGAYLTSAQTTTTPNGIQGLYCLFNYTSSVNAGNIQLQWAQTTSDGTATTLMAESYMMLIPTG